MNIQDVLRDLHVDFVESGHHHCRSGWIQLRVCPFCSSQNYHLGYNIAGHYFHCWRCRGKHPIQVLTRLGLSVSRAEEVAEGINTGVAPKKRERTRISLKEPKGVEPMTLAHQQYLRSRGFDPEEIANLWNVQGLGLRGGHLKWSLYIPIYFQGRKVSWTTRTLGNRSNRYLSASADEEAVNHKEILYGIDFCCRSIVIVEGPTDVWRVGPGAAGTFGTAYTPAQILLISKFPFRYVCYDNERAAQKEAENLCHQLSLFPGHTENIILDAKDPGSAPPKEIKQLRKIAKL